MNAVNYN